MHLQSSPNVAGPRHPLLGAALAFAAGVWCASSTWGSLLSDELPSRGSPDPRWIAGNLVNWPLVLGGGGLLLSVALAACRSRVRRTAILTWFALLGIVRVATLAGPDEHDVGRLASDSPAPVRLEGWIVDSERDPLLLPADTHFTQVRYVLECRSVGESAVPVTGRVLLSLPVDAPRIEAGQFLRVLGELSQPQPARNAGDPDQRQILARAGIRGLLRADFEGICRLGFERPGESVNLHLRRSAARLRDRLRSRFAAAVPQRSRGLAVAMVFGNRSGVTRSTSAAFRDGGVMHLLAISGLHVGLAALLIERFLRLFPIPAGLRLGAAALTLLGYAALTSGRPPVVRAAILVLIALSGRRLGRPIWIVNQLAAAVLVILLWDPLALYDVGAQLSFLAVLALAWAGEQQTPAVDPQFRASMLRRQSLSTKLRHQARLRLLVPLQQMFGLYLITTPLVAARFQMVSVVGLALNPIVVPAMPLILAMSFLTLGTAVFSQRLAAIPGQTLDWGLQGMVQLVGWSREHPAAVIRGLGPTDLWILVYVAAWQCGWMLERYGLRRRWTVFALLGLAAGWWMFHNSPAADTQMRITFLHTGHGGAVLLELPNRRTLLFDAGGLQPASWTARTIERQLQSRNRNHLDLLVISHADADHCNAVPELLLNSPITIRQLAFSRQFAEADQPLVHRILESARSTETDTRQLHAGDRIELCADVELRVLHPGREWNDPDDNNNSLVLSIERGGSRILLCGDIEDRAQQSLRSMNSLTCDVLQSPHHGSLSANEPRFLEETAAGLVVICGSRRSPRGQLRQRCRSHTLVLSTQDAGSITLEVTPDGMIRGSSHLGGRFELPADPRGALRSPSASH